MSALSFGILLSGSPARGADLQSVEALLRQGVDLRHQGHDVLALPLFQKAYGEERTPRTAGQLGLCEIALGYWLDAEKHLGEALTFPEHPWVKKNFSDLTGALASVRQNIGEVFVDGTPAGAEVSVNGKSMGHLPLSAPLRLGTGIVDIELRAPGYSPASRSLTITGTAAERITIVLTKASGDALGQPQLPSSASSAGNEVSGSPVSPANQSSDREAAEAFKARRLRIAGWTTTGVGALALGLGIIESFVWFNKKDQFDNHVEAVPSDPGAGRQKDCGTAEMNYGGPGCQGLHDDLTRARTMAIVGYGLAGALGITSGILFATSRDERSRPSTAFACAPQLPITGVGCRITF